MKKLLLALFVLSLNSQSQTPYYKLLGTTNSEWYIFQAYIPISYGQNPKGNATTLTAPTVSYGKYTAKIDTTLFSKNYKKFYWTYMNPAFLMNNHVGYMREDSAARKVYFMDKTTFAEDLLYDFSLAVGDSAYYTFPATTGNFPKGYYVVKSITNYTTVAGVRNLFTLRKTTAPTSDTLKYIESVGSIIHPVYMYSSYYGMGQFSYMGTPTCKYPYDIGLACKWSDNSKNFQSCTYTAAQFNGCIFKYDSCNYWNTCSGIKENNEFVKHMSVSPNPTSNQATLKLDVRSEINANIEMYDVSGRKIKTISNEKLTAGENNIKIDLNDLQNGYYFVRIKSKEFDLSSPIIISR